MTGGEALKQLRCVAAARAFGRHVASDRLIQVALDALLADLGRREEHEAPELFDRVTEELDIGIEVPGERAASSGGLPVDQGF